MATKAELGKQFLDELVAKLPADRQDALRTTLSSPEAAAALELAGSRLSPLDEERQRLDEQRRTLDTREQKLTDWHGKLDKWKRDTEGDFTEREQKLRAREANPNPTPPDPAAPAKPSEGATVTKEDIQKTIDEYLAPREAGYVAYVADATRLSTFHLQQFKETLDVAAIVRHPKIGELGFEGVYNLVHKEQLDRWKADNAAADREKLKNELRAELAKEQPVDMPYPIGEGSPLDALTLDPDKRPKGDPAAAARLYESLVSGRSA